MQQQTTKVVQCQAAAPPCGQRKQCKLDTDTAVLFTLLRDVLIHPLLGRYVQFAYVIRKLQCAELSGQTENILLVEKLPEVGIIMKDNTGALCKYTLTQIFSWKG